MKKLTPVFISLLVIALISANIFIYLQFNNYKKEISNKNQSLNKQIENLSSLYNSQLDKISKLNEENEKLIKQLEDYQNGLSTNKNDFENQISKLKSQLKNNLTEINILRIKQKDLIVTLNEINDKKSINNDNTLDDKNKKTPVKTVSWEIVTGYLDVYGPYELNNNFLFIYPDGSYNIIGIDGIIKAKGRLDRSVYSSPVFIDKKLYSISKEGYLSLYDFQFEKTKWEVMLTLPSLIPLQVSNEYVLFSTPDKQSVLIHKPSGIIVAKMIFGEWDYPPVIWNEKIYSFTTKISDKTGKPESVLNIYSLDKTFNLIETINLPIGKVIKVTQLDKKLILENENKKVFIFDGKNVDDSKIFNKYFTFDGSNLLASNDDFYQFSNGTLKKIEEKDLIFKVNDWSIYRESNKLKIKNGEAYFEIENKEIKDIRQFQKGVILITTDNMIYYRGLM
jgi:hypothetical protein